MTGTVVKSGVKQFGLKGCALVLAMQVRGGGEGARPSIPVQGRCEHLSGNKAMQSTHACEEGRAVGLRDMDGWGCR